MKSVFKKTLVEFWNSPTIMTFGSFLANALKLIVVLPLVLTRFNIEDITVWYIFATIISLQHLVDIGFSPTFSRVIAYAMVGASANNISDYRKITPKTSNRMPNWKAIEDICAAMRKVYVILTLILIAFLLIVGTASLIRPISENPNPSGAWIAWGIILLTSTVVLRGNSYRAFLTGTNHIAVLRRWEIYSAIGAALSSIAVLTAGGGLISLVCCQQIWVIINILRNRYLSNRVEDGRFKLFRTIKTNKHIIRVVWPNAWRSSLGIIMSYGVVHASGLIYAQLEATSRVATYLIGLRLIQALSSFSQAPFYSKLPILASLRADGAVSDQIAIAKRGMALSYWTFALGFVFLGIFGAPSLKIIGSHADFPDSALWALLGLAMFSERYGAMHIQLYSTTNHIIWHIANGITGAIYLLSSIILYPSVGVYAFPIGMIFGYTFFYCWYSASHSYSAFGLKFWQFEKSTFIAPLLVVSLFVASQLLS